MLGGRGGRPLPASAWRWRCATLSCIGAAGDKRGLLELRKHIAWYVSGLPGASHFRQSLNDLTEPDAVRDALCAFGQACEKNA